MGRSFKVTPSSSPRRHHSTSIDVFGAWSRMQLDERDVLEVLRNIKAYAAVKGSEDLVKAKRLKPSQVPSITRLHVKRPMMKADKDICEKSYNDAIALSRVLPCCSMLRELSLEALCIGDASVADHLSQALRNCKRLQKLDLSNNKIGDDGAIELTRALTGIQCFEQLELDRNRLTDTGALFMYELLITTFPKLQVKLHLDGNKLTRACKKDLQHRHDMQHALASLKL
eukprot:TRINITY_DN4762_c0_g3_i1.p1 TRINITY_DN4762_c0_g3~~TRINITY_DN4762_c0_g3_i1.p1  ORF type:complete len:228 (-),score=20.18 TRINITY_DN4762_c0_g3_i1:88-771(-)